VCGSGVAAAAQKEAAVREQGGYGAKPLSRCAARWGGLKQRAGGELTGCGGQECRKKKT
jgi:hypothetical protein